MKVSVKGIWQEQTALQVFRLHILWVTCHPYLPPLGFQSKPLCHKRALGRSLFCLTHHSLGLMRIQARAHSTKLLNLRFHSGENFCHIYAQYPVAYIVEAVPASSPESELLKYIGILSPPSQGAQTATSHKHHMNDIEFLAAACHQSTGRSISSHTA